MSRAIVIGVMLFAITTSSVAFAGDRGRSDFDRALGIIGTVVAVVQTVKAVSDRPEETPVASRPEMVVGANEPRIRVAITPVKVAPLDGCYNIGWGDDQAAEFVEERFYSVGPAIGNRLGIIFLERAGIEAAIAEQKLANNPAMDPSTFEPMGQGLGAQVQIVPTILRMTIEEKRVGFDYSEWNRGAEYHETQLLVTVWLQTRVVGIGKYIVAPTAESKQTVVVRLDRSGAIGGWRLPDVGYERRDDAVSSALYSATDRAVEDLLCKILPLLRPTASVREGWRYDPASGQPTGAVQCPVCRREMPAGANFCPFDGADLHQRQAAPTSSRKFDPGYPTR